MLGWIRKFDLRKAGICGVVIGGINIIVHIFVIANIIPYFSFRSRLAISTSAV